MNSKRPLRGWPRIVVIAAVLNAGAAAVVAQVADRLEGRPLAEALRGLQARGLRIVFTSATATPDLIVKSEPRATAARQQLDEILAPHALVARDGPAGIIQIVRGEPAVAKPRELARGALAGRVADARDGAPLAGVTVRVEGSNSATRTDVQGRFLLQNVPTGIRTLVGSVAGYAAVTRSVEVVEAAPVAVSLSLSPTPRPQHEYVSVVTPAPPRTDPGVVSELRVDRRQLERLNGGLADDPLRLVHTLPGWRWSTSSARSLRYEAARGVTSIS